MLLQQQDALESPIYKRAECVDKIACEYKHYALINWLQTKLKIKKKKNKEQQQQNTKNGEKLKCSPATSFVMLTGVLWF